SVRPSHATLSPSPPPPPFPYTTLFRSCAECPLEVPFPLSIFHRCFAHLVVTASRAALSDAGRGDLGDHVLNRFGDGGDRRGQRGVAHGAVPDLFARSEAHASELQSRFDLV